MSRLTKFFRLSAVDRWLVLEALMLLGFARLAVLTLPFRWIASRLGYQNNRIPNIDKQTSLLALQIDRIAWAVRSTSRHTPWRSNCLAKAIAGRVMLHRRCIASTLYFGVTKNTGNEFEAHAWLECGEMILTGGSNLERYAIVAKFTD